MHNRQAMIFKKAISQTIGGSCVLAALITGQSAFACKCAVFASPTEQNDRSDLSFVGQTVLQDDKGIQFRIGRVVKGSLAHIGADPVTIEWAHDVSAMCRAYQGVEVGAIFLVFAKTTFGRPLSVLTDCYSDTVAVKDHYYFRGEKFTDFGFFKVNAISAMNGLAVGNFAGNTNQDAAIALARDYLFRNEDFKRAHFPDAKKWNSRDDDWVTQSAELLRDSQDQPHWDVRIGMQPFIKGGFYTVRFYNADRASFSISPGE